MNTKKDQRQVFIFAFFNFFNFNFISFTQEYRKVLGMLECDPKIMNMGLRLTSYFL